MATTYSTGNQTKEKIIKEAKKLLYKNGFSNTTYDHISQAAGINRALIPYHFTSKQILGQVIYSDIMNDFLTHFDSIMDIDEFSPDFVSILHMVAYYKLLENKPFTRFLAQLQADISFSDFLEESESTLIEGFFQKNNRLTEEEHRILLRSEIGMKKELIRMIEQSFVNIDTIAKMQLVLLLSYAGYSKKKIEELYDSATQVIDLLDFTITDEFNVEISFR